MNVAAAFLLLAGMSGTANASLIIDEIIHRVNGGFQTSEYVYDSVGQIMQFGVRLVGFDEDVDALSVTADETGPKFYFEINGKGRWATYYRTSGTIVTFNYTITAEDFGAVTMSASSDAPIQGGTVSGLYQNSPTSESLDDFTPQYGGRGYYDYSDFNDNNDISISIPGGMTVTPSELITAEGSYYSQTITVTLTPAPSAQTTYNINYGDATGLVDGPLAKTVAANTGAFTISGIRALDNFAASTVTITESGGSANGTFTLSATNCPPVITTPVQNSTITTAVGQDVLFAGFATDPAGDKDTLTYTWSFGDGAVGTQVSNTVTHAYVAAGTYTAVLTVSDGDGGIATRTVTVNVENGNLIVVSPATSGNGLQEGLGTGTFQFTDPATTWKPGGNRFPSTEPNAVSAVAVKPVPDAGSYLFGWSSGDDADAIRGTGKILLASDSPILVDMSTDRQLSFYFSKAWSSMDNFGDIDADGLSDAWEMKWFNAGAAITMDDDDLSTLSAIQPGGIYGSGGNPDGDYLPGSSATVEVDNVVLGGSNKVRVFQYPIVPSGNWQWNGYAPDPSNPFNNLIEFRGLEELREGSSQWHRYAVSLPSVANAAERGNCPATDPFNAGSVSNRVTGVSGNDTDGDGLPDGWEYYFWTTIMYEVNTNQWVAFDNNFASYDFENHTFTNSFILDRISKEELLNMFDPAYDCLDPMADPDNDGLTNFEEYYAGTNPLHWDTDGDGLPDGWEVLNYLDPLSAVGEHGSDGNPDGDFCAEMSGTFSVEGGTSANPALDGGGYKIGSAQHAQVYMMRRDGAGPWNGASYSGFHPQVGWTEVKGLSKAFTNYDEFMLSYYYMYMNYYMLGVETEVSPQTWGTLTTNPRNNNTDGDSTPDGWELFVGVSPVNLIWPDAVDFALQPTVEPEFDGDGLFGAQAEFSSISTAAIREEDEVTDAYDAKGNLLAAGVNKICAFPNIYPDWTNKIYPTDPWNADTDGDGLMDDLEYMEIEDVNLDGSLLVNLNPTSVDSDRDMLPDFWEYSWGLQTTNDTPQSAYDSVYGMYGDPDCDGLSNYQEYLTGINRGWRGDYWIAQNHKDYTSGMISAGELIPPAYGTFSSFDMLRPLPDPEKTRQSEQSYRDYLQFLATNTVATLGDWRLVCEESDQMDVYLETVWYLYALEFDGSSTGALAPDLAKRDFPRSFGRCPYDWDPAYTINEEKYLYFFYPGAVSTNPRSFDTDGDGMDDYFEIFHGINPIWGLGNDGNTFLLTYYGTGELLQTYPYDGYKAPWTLGSPFADPDQDGYNNREESVEFYAQDSYYNSDPTPYWLTDTSYDKSHVNLYYQSGDMTVMNFGDITPSQAAWPFGFKYLEEVDSLVTYIAPKYLFAFETNEGFDTDNDNISDREENTTTDLRGVSDMLDHSDPSSRKAMYFDGVSAACRTRVPYFHDKWSLTSYTVEMWFMAENPAQPGKYQTLIERPVVSEIDDQTGLEKTEIRRTFRLQITPDGTLRGEVQNDAAATFTTETAIENGKISPNAWYHVAVTMDSVKNEYSIYLNGSLIQRVKCGLKPCTGYFPGLQDVEEDTEEDTIVQTDVFSFSPAPIVIGASDNNPGGVIGGAPMYSDNVTLLPPSEPVLYNFYQGWIDEVRVWDRVRTQSEIQTDMYKKYTPDDVWAVNHKRFAWEQENWILATALSDFPQKLLYHYSFDNIPAVVADPNRDPSVQPIPSDVEPFPSGINERLGAPDADYVIPWWAESRLRSNIYDTYLGYIPWAENTAAHLPQFPPLTIKRVLPVYDKDYNVIGYRKRESADWLAEVGGTVGESSDEDEAGNTNIVLSADLVPNSQSPYSQIYWPGIERKHDISPDIPFVNMYSTHNYELVPVFSDLLPLNGARTDIDVDLWDGNGPGYETSSIDSDGDGIPDWYEIMYGLDPYSAEGVNGAYGDYDGDGLDNYSEYLAGTAANSSDTDGDGVCDYFERDDNKSLTYGELYDDGDGMPSEWEIQNGLDPNRYDADEDPDADGWTNYEEYMAGTLPNVSSSFPVPNVRFNVHYNGEQLTNIPQVVFYGYSEKHAGEGMGGDYDAKWMDLPNIVGDYFTIDTASRQGRLAYGSIIAGSVTLTGTITGADGVQTEITLNDAKLNDNTGSFADGLYIDYVSGTLMDQTPDGEYSGIIFVASYSHGYTFPTQLTPLQTLTGGKHLRSGYNRFFAFIDINGDQEYTEGEPCGISTLRPTLVSWNDFDVDMFLSDDLFAYPRISWPASTNAVSEYTVSLSLASSVKASIKIPAPRTFMHEGDLINAGLYGLDFASTATPNFSYTVSDGTDIIKTGVIKWNLGTNASRRKMEAKEPSEVVNGSYVQFAWKMDARNAGARITIKSKDGSKTYYDAIIPVPVQHGTDEDADMYYTAVPQLEDGKSFFSLPDGDYTYTIKENVPGSAVTPQSVTGTFTVQNDGSARDTYSISGVIEYYGKVNNEKVTEALHTFNGTETTVTGTVSLPAEMIPGTVTFRIIDGLGFTVDSARDSGADGILYPDSGILTSGEINYKTGEYKLSYSVPPASGNKLQLVYKDFSVQIVIEAFKLSDNAESGTTANGSIVSRTVQYNKGAYSISGLKAGRYSVRAFIDSNGNSKCDDWESSGFAVSAAKNYSPTYYTKYGAFDVPSSVVGADIVIFDKDTDNDLLPDAWEYANFGSLDESGRTYRDGVYIWQEYADGALDSDPNRVDTDNDGLSDAVEINTTHTDTHNPDSDGDGVGDLEEFLSGSDPNDPNDCKRYVTLGVEFDEDGDPYVDCPYPQMSAGNTITFILRYQRELGGEWTDVCEASVAPPMVIGGKIDAGVLRMVPEKGTVDWKSGFFKVDVQVDYQRFEIREE